MSKADAAADIKRYLEGRMPADERSELEKGVDDEALAMALSHHGLSVHLDPLQPEKYEESVSYEIIQSYIDGTAGDLDRSIVDSLRADDPVLDQMIKEVEQVKREVEATGNPVLQPSTHIIRNEPSKSIWLPWLHAALGAVAASCLLGFLYIFPRWDAGQKASQSGQMVAELAKENSDLKDRLALQERLVSTKHDAAINAEKGLTDARASLDRVKKELEAAKNEANRAKAMQITGSPNRPLIPSVNIQSDKPVLRLPDGGEIVVTSRGTYTRRQLERDSAAAVVSSDLGISQNLIQQNSQVATARGSGPTAITPSNTYVQSQNPVLKWKGKDNSTFIVTINEGTNVIAKSQALKVQNWQSGVTLEPGKSYTWSVEETTAEGQTSTGYFKFITMTADQKSQLKEALNRSSNSIEKIRTYAKFGLLDDAESEISSLESINKDSIVLQRWRQKIQMARLGQ